MRRLLTFLLTLLLLTTSSASFPTDVCNPGKPLHKNRCNSTSIFNLYNITYSSFLTYSTPSHLAVAEGQISFNLSVTTVPYKMYCTASSSRVFGFFFGEIVYHCDALTGQGVDKGAGANFTFSSQDNAFYVNETWSCDRGGNNKTEKFLGTGSGKAALDCETNAWTNANWTGGEIYSYTTTKCKPGELQIIPTVVMTH